MIPTLSAGILFTGERLVYPPEFILLHLSVCLPLLIQPLLRNVEVLDWNRQVSNHYDGVRWGHLAGLRRWIANCQIYRALFLDASNFERCVPSDMKINGTSVSPSLSIAFTWVSTVLSSSVSAYKSLPPPVHSLQFGREAFLWLIAVKATLRGVNLMLSIGWLPHQPSHASDDVSTPVFDTALLIVLPSHILESV